MINIRVGSTGLDVRQVQERLAEDGYYTHKIDGDFGPMTLVAVRAFQDQNSLPVTGVVDARTWALLYPEHAATEVRRAMKDLAHPLYAMVIKVAQEQVGVREIGGDNRGPEIEKYQRDCGGHPGQAWCMYAVQWIWKEACRRLNLPDLCKPDTGHCLTFWNACRQKGWTLPVEQARPGDIMIMDFGGGRGHTGIVQYAANGILQVMEGNTNASGGREGDCFMTRRRAMDHPLIKGVVRVPVP